MIRISIITITYQAARSLQRTLDSVARQTYPHIEHLIVDGASKDATLDIARRYQQCSTHEVIITSEPDKGLYDAMNKGLQRATGDYVVFLNAGDTLHAADTIQTVVRAACGIPDAPANVSATPGDAHSEDAPVTAAETLSADAPAVIYGDTAITDAEGRFLHLRTHRPPEVLTWRSFKKGMLVCHQAFYVRLDIARQFPYQLEYRHSADVDWCIRIMKEAERRCLPLVNTHVVVADFEEGGDTTQHHRASLLERYRVMADHYGTFQTFLLHCWFVVRAVWFKLHQ